jgi:hypothetical protein
MEKSRQAEGLPNASNSGFVKNPFKVGEKVITKVDSKEVEAVVTKLWQNEVQVRTPDNELRWRSMYTVWYPGAAPLVRDQRATKPIATPAGGNSAAPKPSAKAKKAAQKQAKKRR